MTADKLADEIERRLAELEITINKATNFRAFGDQFNEKLWPMWQEAQVEEERCRQEFRLLTKIITALRAERPQSGKPVFQAFASGTVQWEEEKCEQCGKTIILNARRPQSSKPCPFCGRTDPHSHTPGPLGMS